METLDLSSISFRERFILLQQVWESLQKEDNTIELSPQWHNEILKNRAMATQEKFIGFDEAKKRLYKVVDAD